MTKVGNNGELSLTADNMPDNVLIEKIKNGDKEAFGDLVKRYQDRIFNTVYRLLGSWHNASEVTQRTFILGYKNIAGFRGASAFSTWLHRIAFNQSISFKREEAAHKVISFYSNSNSDDEDNNSMNEPVERDENPLHILEMNERHKMLQQGLNELSREERDVIVLKDIDGNSYKEIAEILGIEVTTVRSRLHRARLHLKEKMKLIIETPK